MKKLLKEVKRFFVVSLLSSLILTSFFIVVCLTVLTSCSVGEQFDYRYCIAPGPPCEEEIE